MSNDTILLGHGGGGRMTRELLEEYLLPPLNNPLLEKLDDSAVLPRRDTATTFTTDSYVIDPLEFPGGDIGKLAVCGTVNDLSMQGGKPLYLSLALIIEEGFSFSALKRIIKSLAQTAESAGVSIVTGDTKVVERGKAGGMYINTTGIGELPPNIDVSVSNAQPGDDIIISGTVGDHGLAVMAAREALALKSELVSDLAPLNDLAQELLEKFPDIHCLRDPTRSGLTGALIDIAASSGVGITIKQNDVPVRREVSGACRILGLEPMSSANEGKAVIVTKPEDTQQVLSLLRGSRHGVEASHIGKVVDEHPGRVVAETSIKGRRFLTLPAGEQLPRIC